MKTAARPTSEHHESEPSEGSIYRPIGEVAALLRLQPHVLRFWETKFKQIAPLKRSGGRRYYRREDVRLLFHIRDLLYVEGYTLRGAQKALRDKDKDRDRGRKSSQINETNEETTAEEITNEETTSEQREGDTLTLSPAVRADLQRLTESLEKTLALCEEEAQEAQTDEAAAGASSGEQ